MPSRTGHRLLAMLTGAAFMAAGFAHECGELSLCLLGDAPKSL
jgi:hypothetical protein